MTARHSIPDTNISALILAGGRGSRMGGQDKGLITVAGKPAIEHVLERLRPQLNTILISANRNLDRYAAYGYPLVKDHSSDFPGPLAGIAAGFDACHSDWLLCLPVDAPLLDAHYVQRMKTAVQDSGADAALATLNGRPEPVFCLLHRRHQPALLDYLASGKRAVQGWLQEIGAQAVDFSDCPEQFMNLNLEQDQPELEARLQQHG